MDGSGIGFGQNAAFGHPTRAFPEEVAGPPEGESLPRCATYAEDVRNIGILAAATESAGNQGTRVAVAGGQTVSADR